MSPVSLERLKIMTAVALVGSLAAHAALAETREWPQWRGPQADGSWDAPAIRSPFPAAGLPQVWSQPLGAGYSGLAVAQNYVWTMDRPGEPAETERVLCFDAHDGQPRWTHAYRAEYGKLDYGKGPRATPTFHAGRLYTLGAVGHLFCLDAATGTVLWSRDLVRDFHARLSEWGFAASPVVYQHLVIVHAALQPGGCFAAFDRLSGEEVWRCGEDPAGYCTPILVEHQGRDLLLGWTPEHVVGIEPQRGELLWKYPYKVTYGVSIATPLYREGQVLVAGYWEGSKALRLGRTPDQVELAWEENRYLRGLMSQPLYRDGYGYLLDKQHGLVCFEWQTGKKVWTDDNRLTPRGRNPQANLVWMGNSDRALALNSNGELILLRLSPGGYEELSRTRILGETWAHPAFAGHRVYARDDERLVCVELP